MSKIVETKLSVSDWFEQLEEEVDVWITDPPYPFNNKNGAGRFNFIDGIDNMYNRLNWTQLAQTYQDMFDKTSKNGLAYIFCNKDTLFKTKDILDGIGWKFRNIIVWDKLAMGMGYHWRNQLEYIVYVSKSDISKKDFVMSSPNIFKIKKPTKKDSIQEIGYKVEGESPKPYKIWNDIMISQDYTDRVFADPFSGSNPMRTAILMNEELELKIKKAYTNSF